MTIVSSRKIKLLAAVLLVFAIVAGVSTTMNKKVEAACSHSFYVQVPTVYPTCISTGSAVRVCADCGYAWSVTLPKTAHNYVRVTVCSPASCTRTGTEYCRCSYCSATCYRTIPATGHQLYSIYRNGHTEWYCAICNQRFS